MFHSIKAVLFDLDETLLDDRAGQLIAARRVCDAFSDMVGSDALTFFETYLQVSDDIWGSLGSVPDGTYQGLSGGQAIRLRVWEDTVARLGYRNEDVALEAAQLYALERERTYTLFPEVTTVLERLKSYFPVGIVTNGATGTQREKLRSTGLDKFTAHVVVSGELGYGKPDPRIFRKILDELGVHPSEAVHIGDSLETDVAGAKAAGLRAVWLNRKGITGPQADAVVPDACILSLSELPRLLHSP